MRGSRVLVVFLQITSFVTSCFGDLLVKSNGDLDSHAVEKHILQLEQTVSALKTQLQLQDQKQAAVLSSVLSKLASTTDDLTNLKSDFHDLKDNHTSSLQELFSVRNQLSTALKEVSDMKAEVVSFRQDQESMKAELTEVKDNLNSTSTDIERTNTEITVLKTRTDTTLLELNCIKEELNSTERTLAGNTDVFEQLRDSLTSQAAELLSHNSELITTNTTTNTATNTELKLLWSTNLWNIENTIQNLNQSINKISATVSNLQTKVFFQATLLIDTPTTPGKPISFPHVPGGAGNDYIPSNGTFVAPVSGVYMFWAQFGVNNTSDLWIFLVRNKQEYRRAFTYNGTTNNVGSVSAVMHLDLGDGVWLTGSKGGVILKRYLCQFGGTLLRAD